MKKIVPLLAATLLGCSDSDPNRFNLVCALTAYSIEPGGPELNMKIVLHVDLHRGIFCQDERTSPLPIVNVTPGRLVFQDNSI